MSKVAKSFICRGCLNPVTSAVRTSVDIGASAKLELLAFSALTLLVGRQEGHTACKKLRTRPGLLLIKLVAWHSGRTSLTGELSLSCARPAADG